MPRLVYLLIILNFILLTTCSQEKNISKTNNKIQIITSLFPVSDIVKNISGQQNVDFILPPGVSPHDFEPNPNQLKKYANVKLIILIGGDIDEWVLKLLSNLKYKNDLRIINLHSSIIKSNYYKIHLTKEYHPHDDPHIWLDPILVQEMVKIITKELILLNPKEKSRYNQNRDKYLKQLNELNTKIIDTLSHFKKKDYISYHGAFDYFSRRYGLNTLIVIKRSVNKELSVIEMKKIIHTGKKNKIQYIVTEPQLNPKEALVIAEELDAKIITIDPIGDPRDPSKNTYIRLMEYNLNIFKKIFEGR